LCQGRDTHRASLQKHEPGTREEQRKKTADYIRAWGIENVAFGSDWIFSSPADHLRNVEEQKGMDAFCPLSTLFSFSE
jgi:hypothetical protein